MVWAINALQSDTVQPSIYLDGVNAQPTVPDLIIFDVRYASGEEQDVLQRLKADPLTGPAPVIFLCADSDIFAQWPECQGNDHCLVAPVSPETLRLWVQKSLVAFGLALADTDQPVVAAETLSDQTLMRLAKSYLTQHYAKTTGLEDVAAALKVNPQHLADTFYSFMGLTMAEFLTQERMHKAQRLLLQSSLDMSAIAEAVGYISAARFVAAFREFTGLTPSAYRRDPPLDNLTTQGIIRWSSG